MRSVVVVVVVVVVIVVDETPEDVWDQKQSRISWLSNQRAKVIASLL
jgi:hypothetical protein